MNSTPRPVPQNVLSFPQYERDDAVDFYHRPGKLVRVGANDLSLRKCLETKVDIFKSR